MGNNQSQRQNQTTHNSYQHTDMMAGHNLGINPTTSANLTPTVNADLSVDARQDVHADGKAEANTYGTAVTIAVGDNNTLYSPSVEVRPKVTSAPNTQLSVHADNTFELNNPINVHADQHGGGASSNTHNPVQRGGKQDATWSKPTDVKMGSM